MSTVNLIPFLLGIGYIYLLLQKCKKKKITRWKNGTKTLTKYGWNLLQAGKLKNPQLICDSIRLGSSTSKSQSLKICYNVGRHRIHDASDTDLLKEIYEELKAK